MELKAFGGFKISRISKKKINNFKKTNIWFYNQCKIEYISPYAIRYVLKDNKIAIYNKKGIPTLKEVNK